METVTDSRATSFHSGTRRSHPQGSSQKVDSSIRNASKSRGVESRLEAKYTYNPVSAKSQDMIRSMGMWCTSQCVRSLLKFSAPHCLTYCTKGIVHCTCGTFLRPTDKTRKLNKDRFDALSDPTLQDNVMLPSDFAEFMYHVGSSHDLRSIILSGLVAGGKDVKKKGGQTVFFAELESTSEYSVLGRPLRRGRTRSSFTTLSQHLPLKKWW